MRAMRLIAVPFVLALAACGKMGGGEDFAVEMKSSTKSTYAVLSAAKAGDVVQFLPGLKFAMSRPSDLEVLYTIPMKAHASERESATILFTLDPAPDGKVTVVHVTADVPAIPMLMGKANMYLSEDKVEAELRKVLERIAKNLASGSSSPSLAEPLSDLLVSVAIAGNSDLQALANQGGAKRSGMSDLFGGAETGEAVDVERAPLDVAADPETIGRPEVVPPDQEPRDDFERENFETEETVE
jgi:hypothetical protein